MNTLTNLKIGTATMIYHQDGTMKEAFFNPTIKLDAKKDLLEKLQEIQGISQTSVKEKADLVFADWFNAIEKQLDEIETADRTKFYVHSEIIKCDNYPNSNSVKECVVDYYFRERE